MADNFKDGPERILTFLVGHDAANKGGKQAVGTWATKAYVDSTFATAAALAALDGDLDALAASVTSLDAANAKLNGTATWNNGATTFTLFKYNVTDTASAVGSLLMDFQVGGASKYSVRKDGFVLAGAEIRATAQLTSLAGTLNLLNNTSSILMGGASDLSAFRDAADIWAQRRTTNAQTWRLYNTFTSATNYERLTITWSSNLCQIKTEANTGTRRSLALTYKPDTVAALPAAATVGDGTMMFVLDALDPVFGKAVVGGGAVHIPVYTDGTTWFCGASVPQKEAIPVAVTDETTAITTGTSKIKFRMPYAMTVSTVKASLNVAQSSGNIVTVDINEAGSTILSTKLTIDNGETTSTTAAAAAVISDTALGNDAEITVDIDQVGDGTAVGLKITLIGWRT